MNRKSSIRYNEGQWFAIPLKNGGYALGIIARGNFVTRGGLGFFFGPKYLVRPNVKDTLDKNASKAILTAWFGDLNIINGIWPLIEGEESFIREYWPVPRFKRIDPLNPKYGWLVEYSQDDDGSMKVIREVYTPSVDLVNYPFDALYGAGAIEEVLSRLLSDT